MASNINVHVSVTINTPENGGPGSSSSSTAGLPKMSSERNPNNISQISTSSPNPKNLMMHPSSRVRIENSNSPANMSPNIQGENPIKILEVKGNTLDITDPVELKVHTNMFKQR